MKNTILIGLSILMSGCALIQDDYGCPGMPDDPVCMSTLNSYQATHNTTKISPDLKQERPKETSDDEASEAKSPILDNPSVPTDAHAMPTPVITDPTPIRTPAKVMRIWVAPWEDGDGDLNVSSYVYTELEERRWMIGSQAPIINPVFTPLQVQQRKEVKDTQKSDALKKFPLDPP